MLFYQYINVFLRRKDLGHFFIWSEAKPKPIIDSRLLIFLCQLHMITWSFDWFTVLSMSFVIGRLISLVSKTIF